MRRYKIVFRVVFFLLLVALPAFLVWQMSKPKPLPSEAQEAKDLCDKIELEMLEQDVDNLLAEYESSTVDFERGEDSAGRPLIRTAYHTKYCMKKGAIEGDYCIIVHLDDSYWKHVVGKTWSGLDK